MRTVCCVSACYEVFWASLHRNPSGSPSSGAPVALWVSQPPTLPFSPLSSLLSHFFPFSLFLSLSFFPSLSPIFTFFTFFLPFFYQKTFSVTFPPFSGQSDASLCNFLARTRHLPQHKKLRRTRLVVKENLAIFFRIFVHNQTEGPN